MQKRLRPAFKPSPLSTIIDEGADDAVSEKRIKSKRKVKDPPLRPMLVAQQLGRIVTKYHKMVSDQIDSFNEQRLPEMTEARLMQMKGFIDQQSRNADEQTRKMDEQSRQIEKIIERLSHRAKDCNDDSAQISKERRSLETWLTLLEPPEDRRTSRLATLETNVEKFVNSVSTHEKALEKLKRGFDVTLEEQNAELCRLLDIEDEKLADRCHESAEENRRSVRWLLADVNHWKDSTIKELPNALNRRMHDAVSTFQECVNTIEEVKVHVIGNSGAPLETEDSSGKI